MKQAIVLCSGGLDSSVVAYMVKSKKEYSNIKIVFFDYNQRASKMEMKCSKIICNEIKGEFVLLRIEDISKISSCAIIENKEVKKSESLKNTKKESDSWYVPCRNLIFLSYALAIAENDFVNKNIKSDIYVGFKSEGNEPFPDTTKEFVDKINLISKESCAYPFKVIAPLIEKDKEDIILIGEELGMHIEKTYSCYIGNEKQCGECLACRLRKEGFKWAGKEDKTEYLK